MPKAQVIDLSHHNTVVSLHDAAASGIVGVIHKATEGVKMVDKTARARFSLARDAGLLWGVYHFMRPGDVQDQVDHFLANSPADDKTLYVLDFEVDGITLYQVLEFLDTVEQQTSQIPVLYTGGTIKGLGGAARIPALTAYRLWLAQYSSRPVLPKGYDKLWLWQYSQEGKVPGITGNCDVNAYNGTAEALRNDWVQDSAAIASNNPPDNSIKGESGVTSDANSTSPPNTSEIPNSSDQKSDKPPPEPQNIKKEKTSTFTKWYVGVKLAIAGAIASITATCGGNEIVNLAAKQGTEKVITNADRSDLYVIGLVLVYVAIGLGAAVALAYIASKVWDHASDRTGRLNQEKMQIAADQQKATVEFTK